MPSLFSGPPKMPAPPKPPNPPPDPTLTQQALENRKRAGANSTILAGDLTRGARGSTPATKSLLGA